ncbi:MAG: hypothetical protein QW057_04290 [Candidatus Bathyarchaeia archaeon]
MRSKDQLWDLIKRQPGLSPVQASSQLNWPMRKVRQLLARLEGENRVVSKVYPVEAAELEDALVRLEGGLRGLAVLKERMRERENKLFEETVKAKESGDEAKAKIYAEECARVRGLLAWVERNEAQVEEFSQRVRASLTRAFVEPP